MPLLLWLILTARACQVLPRTPHGVRPNRSLEIAAGKAARSVDHTHILETRHITCSCTCGSGQNAHASRVQRHTAWTVRRTRQDRSLSTLLIAIAPRAAVSRRRSWPAAQW